MSSLLFVLALLDWVGLLQFFIPDHFLYFSISVPAIFSNKPIGSWLPSANGGWQNQALVQCTSIFTLSVFCYSFLPTASGRLNLPIFMLSRNS
jgi:hypothetical protein